MPMNDVRTLADRITTFALFLVFGLLAALLASCGGTSGSVPLPDEPPTISLDGQGRTAIGALGGATVSIYRVGDYTTPVATATSSTTGAPQEIGRFFFTLTDVPPDAMFFFVATGG